MDEGSLIGWMLVIVIALVILTACGVVSLTLLTLLLGLL